MLSASKAELSGLPAAGEAGRAFVTKPIAFGALAGAVAAFPSLALRLVTAAGESAGTGGGS